MSTSRSAWVPVRPDILILTDKKIRHWLFMEQLDHDLFAELKFQLTWHTNLRIWEGLDHLTNDDWENINATIRDVFAPWIRRYAYTDVVPALQQCRNMLVHVVWAAMNVPYPRNPYEHILSVVDNAMNAFRHTAYALEVYQKMLVADHYAHLIQRNWRRCIADPSYEACRKRLIREISEDFFNSAETTNDVV